MHPSEPFRTSASPEEMHYIYVTRASLKTVVAELTGPSKNEDVATGARYRSEYMRCMDRVIEELDITDDHQPKKVSVEEAIQRNWTGAIPLSPTDVKHLASFIRNPDSRAGRNRTKSG